MIVPLIVFLSLQRYFVRGLLAGSVKGGLSITKVRGKAFEGTRAGTRTDPTRSERQHVAKLVG